ncbi:DUF3147 family protein [bacterium]|jgi:hypothetical protein|nr:DUF3147 family protein [bacterium]
MQIFIKIILTSLIVVSISEIAKRVSWFAAILASLPLTSIMAMIWLYIETGSSQKVVELSNDIFWAVLPSLLFFIVFPLLIKRGFHFSLALLFSILIMFIGYTGYMLSLNVFKS